MEPSIVVVPRLFIGVFGEIDGVLYYICLYKALHFGCDDNVPSMGKFKILSGPMDSCE